MNLQERINLLVKLGEYFQANSPEWMAVKENAERQNGWFTQAFIHQSVASITHNYLHGGKLSAFANACAVPALQSTPLTAGIVMAGNIPLVGFHDWLCVFLSGHNARIKTSSKDRVLLTHIIEKLAGWAPEITTQSVFSDMLKGCDAYIATGSNHSARYFEYYFSKYAHIIRRNRTSVAILTGQETAEDLDRLTDDINFYYGLGCRNVTKIWVPGGYDFVPLLEANKKYAHFADHNKYKNNYDYQLAILLLNNHYYMTNGALLLVENEAFFSAISQLHYSFYKGDAEAIAAGLQNHPDIQCVVGSGTGIIPFGRAQQPELADFADGVDTMQFLLKLGEPEA
jgi:hypothetical protein